jgi:charged multivesicular body protein 2A
LLRLRPRAQGLRAQETLFGRTVTPAERLRQNQRALNKAERELDRERAKLEQSEKKLVADIKRSAKAGQLVRPGA